MLKGFGIEFIQEKFSSTMQNRTFIFLYFINNLSYLSKSNLGLTSKAYRVNTVRKSMLNPRWQLPAK